MKERHYKHTLTIILLLLFCNLSNAKFGHFSLNKHNRKTIIPFKLVNNNILIQLTINNSKPLTFIFDTGLKNTLITQIEPQDSVQLNNVGERILRGLGSGKNIKVKMSANNTIRLKGIEGKHQSLLFAEENSLNISELSGERINGIIGYNLLRDFVIKIDYYRKLITLYDPSHYNKKLRSYMHYPLVLKESKPYITTQIIDPAKKKHTIELMMDTGASIALWLTDNDSIKIAKPKKMLTGFIGEGLSGKVYGDFGRIPAIIFKNKKLKNIITAFPHEKDIKGIKLQGRSGSMGGILLSRFNIIFNYPHKYIALRPNVSFSYPFKYNKCGITIYTPNNEKGVYKVFSIQKNAPASHSGLQENDRILEINRKRTDWMTLQEVINALNKKGQLELLIKRGNEKLSVKYALTKHNTI